MAYLTDRLFRDAAGYIFREHRPGFIRRDGAEVNPSTEHAITPSLVERFLIGSGCYVIEEEP